MMNHAIRSAIAVAALSPAAAGIDQGAPVVAQTIRLPRSGQAQTEL
jgi:hypothetical protein